jgi:O-acetyl-ADP-ribose deacetylase (regulator of RNase III)
MGKGIALQFKERYPKMFLEYKEACEKSYLRPGKLHLYKDDIWIVNFPTKVDWRNPSKYDWVEAGLARLFAKTIPDLQLKSVGIPALGCSNGGLAWSNVKKIIEKWYYVFDDVLENVDVKIYEPL